MKLTTPACLFALGLLGLAPGAHAQDACAAMIEQLQDQTQDDNPGGAGLDALRSADLEDAIARLQACQRRGNADADYEDMLGQLKDELLNRYRGYLQRHGQLAPLQREELARAPQPVYRDEAPEAEPQVPLASRVPPRTGSRISPQEAQAALDFHNAKRREVGVPALAWSAPLAGTAQRWAEHLAATRGCQLEHTQNNPYGENLFAGNGYPYGALDAAQSWYEEIRQYRYGPVTAKNYHATGHYTQMVWRDTTQVGIGKAQCADGGVVIAAEYSPAGNYLGQRPY